MSIWPIGMENPEGLPWSAFSPSSLQIGQAFWQLLCHAWSGLSVRNLEVIHGAGVNFSQKVGPGNLSPVFGTLQPAPVECRVKWYRVYKQPVVPEKPFKQMVFRNR